MGIENWLLMLLLLPSSSPSIRSYARFCELFSFFYFGGRVIDLGQYSWLALIEMRSKFSQKTPVRVDGISNEINLWTGGKILIYFFFFNVRRCGVE